MMVPLLLKSIRRYDVHILLSALLVLLTWWIYGEIVNHEFLTDWDDPIYVTGNEAIRGITPEHLQTAFSSFYLGNYSPIQIVSYMIDYTLWGLSAFGFKLTNMILHGLNGVVFYLLLVRLTQRTAPAFISALIFLCHPVQVESVAWVSQRKNLLAMLFFLCAFHLYVSYRENRNSRAWPYYAGSQAAFFVALLAKPVAVIFPIVMVLYDLCFRKAGEKRCGIRDKIPFFAIAGAFSILIWTSQSAEFQGGKTGYHGGSPWATFITMVTVLLRYLKMLFWPAELSAGYYIPIITAIDLRVMLSFLAIALLTATAALLYVRKRELFFWYALFFIALLPVSQIVPLVTLMNDRYLYFPLLGAGTFVVLAITDPQLRPAPLRTVLVCVLCLALIPLSVTARQRTEVWRNSLALWGDTIRKMPQAAIAWASMGTACLNAGKEEAAIDNYRQALLIDPGNMTALTTMGLLYATRGNYAAAEWYLRQALKTDPDHASPLEYLAAMHLLQGNTGSAEALCRQALALPDCSQSLWILSGNVAVMQQNTAEALKCYAVALEHPGDEHGRELILALMAAARGNLQQAGVHMKNAQERRLETSAPLEDFYVNTVRILPFHKDLVGGLSH